MAPQDTQADDYSEESLLTLIQALAINQQELASQVGQLQASVTSTTNNTTNTTNTYVTGISLLSAPVLLASGVAFVGSTSVNISTYVPATATGALLQASIDLVVGLGSVKVGGSPWASQQTICIAAGPGIDTGFLPTPCAGQAVTYSVVDGGGGGFGPLGWTLSLIGYF